MDTVIRQATMHDYAGMCDLFAEIDALHAGALPHIFRVARGRSRSRAYIQSILDNPEAGVFVAEQEGRIAGLIDVRLQETADAPILVPRRYAIVDTLVVRHDCQRQGIGQALMARAEQWARERGLSEIGLHVWEFNVGAIAFYERLGYVTLSRRMWRKVE